MQKPNFTVNLIEEEGNFGKFAIEPLENGFGHTLGNALRRVLLSSFRGAAIVEVKIEGVTHKFSTLEGMGEDMVEIMLNLKGVKVAYEGDEPVTAKISVKGPKVVTAKDIVAPSSVKITTPDAPIARLSKGVNLEMELKIDTGYGYSPAKDRNSDVVGAIPLDAIFSPVERVSYTVEATRVGRRTDYDKLVLNLYTDGSVAASDILKEAARTLSEYFTQVYDPKLVVVEKKESPEDEQPSLSLEELGLPTRILNALKNADYSSVAEIADASDKDLKNVKNLGSKSVEILDEALAAKDVTRNK